MYVACPSCKSLYPVTAEYLRLAGGQVRCSNCQTQFDASRAVFEDPREALEYEHPLPQAVRGEINELVDRALDGVGEAAGTSPLPEELVTEAASPQPGDMASPPSQADDVLRPGAGMDWHAWPAASEFTSTPGTASAAAEVGNEVEETGDPPGLVHEHLLEAPELVGPRTAWGVIAAALLLTVGLLVQYAYFDRYRLAQVASLRPALELLCGSLGCDLPLRRDLSQVEMVERDVRQHPNVDGALLVHASFVNHAGFAQAYPVVQVSFSDVSGTPVAVRRLSPSEYLPADTGIDDGMAPGEEALLMVEVVDPGEQAVSFQFDFM